MSPRLKEGMPMGAGTPGTVCPPVARSGRIRNCSSCHRSAGRTRNNRSPPGRTHSTCLGDRMDIARLLAVGFHWPGTNTSSLASQCFRAYPVSTRWSVYLCIAPSGQRPSLANLNRNGNAKVKPIMITLRIKADVQNDRKVIVTLPPEVPTGPAAFGVTVESPGRELPQLSSVRSTIAC